MQVKKEISLILIVTMLAALLAGCSDITAVTLNKNGSGSYSEVFTISKDLWDMSVGTAYDDQSVADLYQSLFPDADVVVSDTVVNDTSSKEIRMTMDFKNKSDFIKLFNTYGITSVKFNKNYFSKAAIWVPGKGDEDQPDSLIPDNFDDLLDENKALMDALIAEMQNMHIKLTITFPYTVLQTNGTIQEDGNTVVWELQNLNEGQERYYAIFQEQTSAKAPVFSGAGNGKYYNTGVTLNIKSENLLDKVTVNGHTSRSDYLSITDEGKYTVNALDLNDNTNSITFYIDMTKPVIKGVKNGAVYKNARTIKFSDKGSGIKKAVLNNKKIISGKKISQKGSYTLAVIDKAGNKKAIKFKIK